MLQLVASLLPKRQAGQAGQATKKLQGIELQEFSVVFLLAMTHAKFPPASLQEAAVPSAN